MNILFVADPMTRFKIRKDSSYAMMAEASRRGYSLFHTQSRELTVKDGLVLARSVPFDFLGAREGEEHDWFRPRRPQNMNLRDFDAVIMRSDPPFDMQYLYATHLLTLAREQGAKVFNSGRSMRELNEKLAILRFPELIPATVVTASSDDIRAFLREQNDVIVKPLDGMGGMGIFRLRPQDPNLGSILETLTDNDRRTIMAQAYIPEIVRGDKRVLVIAGEPIPYVLARIPRPGETRGNLAAGGRGEARELSPRDREIASAVAPELRRMGVLLAGLDIIGDRLTEINVTSPTCMREITDQTGFDVAARFIDALEAEL